jgi:hypothetical protein
MAQGPTKDAPTATAPAPSKEQQGNGTSEVETIDKLS